MMLAGHKEQASIMMEEEPEADLSILEHTTLVTSCPICLKTLHTGI